MMVRFFSLAALLFAAPAHASGAVPVPEPSNMALFALGVLGLLIGRYSAGNGRGDDK